MKKPPVIIYEDADLLIVNKPADLFTIPDRSNSQLSLTGWLQQKYDEVFIVHRLDKETSGVICFARNKEAHRSLSMQFESRTVDKYYFALLDGIPFEKIGVINKPLAPSTTQPGTMVVANRGKNAVTEYEIIEEFKQFALVKANIKTGRMHQIRIHFKSIGFPLAVDALYGRKTELYLSEIKRKKFNIGKFVEEQPIMSRTTLHSASLSFEHPTTQTRMTFEAEMPKDFSALLNQLRKWGK
ncbi:MAG: RluA family pseudouridine synthase [Saprospiraceae bacterium]|nr:RluA family pseudouridine synthase [Saprospiraceae bacterium]MBP7679771.1 RluA family pseudouridine synthase [Saprospiraceae bacterium]